MYEYLKANIIELKPDHAIIDANGVGYFVNISLNTYESITKSKPEKFFLHQSIKEDAHTLYGFAEKSERDLFRLLITVSGIGTNTARLMLSALPPQGLINAIASDNVSMIKSIKGIGPKTAQRVILDLKDKVLNIDSGAVNLASSGNNNSDQALSALVALGFNKMMAGKVLTKVASENPDLDVEGLIKEALKQL